MYYQNNALRNLLGLLRIPVLGPIKLFDLLEKNDTLENIFDPNGYCQLIATKMDWNVIDQDLKWLEDPNCHLISYKDDLYPSSLKQIYAFPPVLFVKGDPNLLSHLQIAIVGSRNPTLSGQEIAFNFAKYFSVHDISVTSGLALGIDAAAHQGSLKESGKTIAVLGNGLNQIYPKENQRLASQILENGGALISEFPLDASPMASNFPRRNRIISGLSEGVLVIEAALKSGSLITAKLALEQGKEVFAVPGSIHNPLSKGCHLLIKEGAKLVESAQDIIEELSNLKNNIKLTKGLKFLKSTLESPMEAKGVLTPNEKSLLSNMGYELTPIDLIIHRSGLTAKAVSSMLVELELKGYILSGMGGYLRTDG